MDTQRRLLGYLKPHTKILSAGLFCAAVTAGITVSIGKFIEKAFDAMKDGDLHLLTILCLIVVGIFFVKGFFSFGQSYFLSLTANRVAAQIRDEIFEHLHNKWIGRGHGIGTVRKQNAVEGRAAVTVIQHFDIRVMPNPFADIHRVPCRDRLVAVGSVSAVPGSWRPGLHPGIG